MSEAMAATIAVCRRVSRYSSSGSEAGTRAGTNRKCMVVTQSGAFGAGQLLWPTRWGGPGEEGVPMDLRETVQSSSVHSGTPVAFITDLETSPPVLDASLRMNS